MGWPFIGETLQLYSQDPNILFATKQKRSFFYHQLHVENKNIIYTKEFSIVTFLRSLLISFVLYRYGDIFKTHILGCRCIMLASPEASRFVLVTHPHLFKPTYPKSKEKLIGPSALFFHQGVYHSQLRKLVRNSLSPNTLQKRVADIEAIAISALESWARGDQVINTFHEMKKVSLIKYIYYNCNK